MPRNERLCTICDEGILCDEIRFLYECTKLHDMRTKYLSSCNRMSSNVHNFIRMLQTSEPDKINNLAKLILHCIEWRGTAITKPPSCAILTVCHIGPRRSGDHKYTLFNILCLHTCRGVTL